MTGKEAGATAYAAFSTFSGGKSLETGQPMKTWDALDPHVQDAWEVAGQTVLREHAFRERQRIISESSEETGGGRV